MSDVNNGDVLRLGAGLIYDGLYDVVNVYHILAVLDSGLDWATVDDYIQDYLDGIYDNLKNTLSEDIGTGSISVANVTQDTTLGSILWSPTWSGTGGGEPTASGVCCFTWGRTYKPRVQIRKYYGVFGEANVVDGSWSNTVQTAVELAMTEHITPQLMATGVTFTGVAYNRDLATTELAHSVASSAEPAYQRRRKRGRGS